jgi:hypothetical protein
MGLLDDAIREHLELKRRRGADPTEIERAEREALGPVRRRFDEPDDAVALDAAPPEELIDEADSEDWHEPIAEGPGSEAGSNVDHDELEPPGPTRHWDEEREDPFPAADPPQRTAGGPRSPAHRLDEETSEYEVPLEHHPEGEDMLEETPDFLQDTPDHDRLWFEQRPPRDFDFDG